MHCHNLSVEEICSIVFELKLPCLLDGGIECAVIPLGCSSNPGITTYINMSTFVVFQNLTMAKLTPNEKAQPKSKIKLLEPVNMDLRNNNYN